MHNPLNQTQRKRWRFSSLGMLVVAGFLILGSGCTNGDSTKSENSAGTETSAKESKAGDLQLSVASDFAAQVVIPTYEQLVIEARELSEAVNAFTSNPTDETLKIAQAAWTKARNPWEQSEAFAFGPADSLGYDGDLDDWPVNETDVKAIVESNDELTADYVKALQTTQKGFHTIELLLFGTDNDKKAADFSERELQLLKLLGEAFSQTSQDLVKSWVEGIDGNPPYQEVLAKAGKSDNQAYPTVAAAVEEIVQGMIGCLDEVANEKIGAPMEAKTTDDLESRFSHTSLNDFKNNIRSVQNAYLGKVPDAGTSGKSVSDLVAKADSKLDEQVKSELESAISAVDAIPDPIEPKIADEEALAKMKAAQDALLTLFATVEEKVLPIVQS